MRSKIVVSNTVQQDYQHAKLCTNANGNSTVNIRLWTHVPNQSLLPRVTMRAKRQKRSQNVAEEATSPLEKIFYGFHWCFALIFNCSEINGRRNSRTNIRWLVPPRPPNKIPGCATLVWTMFIGIQLQKYTWATRRNTLDGFKAASAPFYCSSQLILILLMFAATESTVIKVSHIVNLGLSWVCLLSLPLL